MHLFIAVIVRDFRQTIWMGIISNQENSFAIIHESPSGFVVNVKYDEKRIEKINLKVLR